MLRRWGEKLKSVAKAPATDVGQGWLCEACTSMIEIIRNTQRPLEPPQDGICEGMHQAPIGSMYDAAAQGCGICSKLASQLDERVRSRRQMINQERHLRFKAHEAGKSIHLWFTPHEKWPTSSDEGIMLMLNCSTAPADAFEEDLLHGADTLNAGGSEHGTNISMARRWLETCLKMHPRCAASRETDFTPPRLLDLRNGRIRLKEDIPTTERCDYVALSYCWGAEDTACKLTASNRLSFCSEIPEVLLHRTFKDAVSISRALGFQWLWIDALCIIQSSPNENDDHHNKDWRRHIAIMDRIYQNCVLNITAADGEDPTHGCLSRFEVHKHLACIRMMPQWTRNEKNWRLTRSSSLHLATIDEPGALDERYNDFTHLHLHTRGWVVQERLLSPRTIHFTRRQVFWECSKVPLACKDFPLSMNVELPGLARKGASRGHSPYGWKSADPAFQHARWLDILEDYTRRSLSRPTDRLPAIAGVASRINTVLQDTYGAGHYKSKLLHSLLWQRELISRDGITLSSGPSWSWASVEAGVHWDRRLTVAFRATIQSDMEMALTKPGKTPKKPKMMTASAQIMDMHVDLVDQGNAYGQVRSGCIILHGPFVELLREVHVQECRQEDGRDSPYVVTVGLDNLRSKMLSFAFDSSPLRDWWSSISLLVLWHDDDRMIESGLILVKATDLQSSHHSDVADSRNTFVRAGVFKSCDDGIMFEEWSNPLYKSYTPRTVTII